MNTCAPAPPGPDFRRADGGAFFIAEAGLNHDGDFSRAVELARAAKAAGADAVKFQTAQPGEATGKFTPKAAYMDTPDAARESRYDMALRLHLSKDETRRLKTACDETGILFLSTPFGFESLDFLADELDMPVIKISSTELDHVQYLAAAAAKGRPVILSTGLGAMEEVTEAAGFFKDVPLAVLQCTSEYPAPDADMNLRAMRTMADALGVPAGLSDHSLGHEAALGAVALGACVIEKHFTLDASAPGPDHKASIEPDGLAALIRSARRLEAMLGDGVKRPSPAEEKNRAAVRRGVVAVRALRAGTRLAPDMLACKRPGGGFRPRDLESLAGRVLARDLQEDEPVRPEALLP
ncbi:MAG: N-acetylneuraminate synthase family protein [Rhodospirillales bacterium]